MVCSCCFKTGHNITRCNDDDAITAVARLNLIPTAEIPDAVARTSIQHVSFALTTLDPPILQGSKSTRRARLTDALVAIAQSRIMNLVQDAPRSTDQLSIEYAIYPWLHAYTTLARSEFIRTGSIAIITNGLLQFGESVVEMTSTTLSNYVANLAFSQSATTADVFELEYIINHELSALINHIIDAFPLVIQLKAELVSATASSIIARVQTRRRQGGQEGGGARRKLTIAVQPLHIQDPAEDDDDDQHLCGVCFDELAPISRVITGCNHLFCVDCIEGTAKARGEKSFICCPHCRADITELKMQEEASRTALHTMLQSELR